MKKWRDRGDNNVRSERGRGRVRRTHAIVIFSSLRARLLAPLPFCRPFHLFRDTLVTQCEPPFEPPLATFSHADK